jgi:hypothetical protein
MTDVYTAGLLLTLLFPALSRLVERRWLTPALLFVVAYASSSFLFAYTVE